MDFSSLYTTKQNNFGKNGQRISTRKHCFVLKKKEQKQ